MMRKILLATAVVAALGSISVPASAQIYLQIAPPQPRVEVVPAARMGYAWAPGYWDWRGNRHAWVAGHWERERPGYAYVAPEWRERDGRWYMERNGWQERRADRMARGRDSDGDGVPDRRDAQPYNPNVTQGGMRRDNDGDGVPNRLDNRPNNPNRN